MGEPLNGDSSGVPAKSMQLSSTANKQVSAAKNKHTTTRELLETVFSVLSGN
jgi:hypothetical protein